MAPCVNKGTQAEVIWKKNTVLPVVSESCKILNLDFNGGT